MAFHPVPVLPWTPDKARFTCTPWERSQTVAPVGGQPWPPQLPPVLLVLLPALLRPALSSPPQNLTGITRYQNLDAPVRQPFSPTVLKALVGTQKSLIAMQNDLQQQLRSLDRAAKTHKLAITSSSVEVLRCISTMVKESRPILEYRTRSVWPK